MKYLKTYESFDLKKEEDKLLSFFDELKNCDTMNEIENLKNKVIKYHEKRPDNTYITSMLASLEDCIINKGKLILLKNNENLNEDFFYIETEYKNFGFLDSDILSTCIVKGDKATLYLFNDENRSKIRNYFYSLNIEDKNEIEDWLIDRFRDENVKITPSIISIKIIDKNDVEGTDIIKSIFDDMADEVLEIKFTID